MSYSIHYSYLRRELEKKDYEAKKLRKKLRKVYSVVCGLPAFCLFFLFPPALTWNSKLEINSFGWLWMAFGFNFRNKQRWNFEKKHLAWNSSARFPLHEIVMTPYLLFSGKLLSLDILSTSFIVKQFISCAHS